MMHTWIDTILTCNDKIFNDFNLDNKTCAKWGNLILCSFVLFSFDIVLSVLLRFTDSDYPFGTFKLLLSFWSIWFHRWCVNSSYPSEAYGFTADVYWCSCCLNLCHFVSYLNINRFGLYGLSIPISGFFGRYYGKSVGLVK